MPPGVPSTTSVRAFTLFRAVILDAVKTKFVALYVKSVDVAIALVPLPISKQSAVNVFLPVPPTATLSNPDIFDAATEAFAIFLAICWHKVAFV